MALNRVHCITDVCKKIHKMHRCSRYHYKILLQFTSLLNADTCSDGNFTSFVVPTYSCRYVRVFMLASEEALYKLLITLVGMSVRLCLLCFNKIA